MRACSTHARPRTRVRVQHFPGTWGPLASMFMVDNVDEMRKTILGRMRMQLALGDWRYFIAPTEWVCPIFDCATCHHDNVGVKVWACDLKLSTARHSSTPRRVPTLHSSARSRQCPT